MTTAVQSSGNPHPASMSPDQRLNEAAAIIATGIIRVRMKQSKNTEKTENFCLDDAGRESVHVSDTTEHVGG